MTKMNAFCKNFLIKLRHSGQRKMTVCFKLIFLSILMLVYFLIYFLYFFYIEGGNVRASILSFIFSGLPLLATFSIVFFLSSKVFLSALSSGLVFFTIRHFNALDAATKSNLNLRRYGYDIFIDGSITPTGTTLSLLIYIGHTATLMIVAIAIMEIIRRSIPCQ